jgi:hypothetical protein
MGYCSPKKHKDIQVYTKVHNNTVPEVREPKKKIKQDYESVKNQIMESNTKTVDIQKGTKESNKTKNIPLIKDPFFLYHIIYNIWLKL